jgi:uncharacterized protein (TIGR03790 family)
LTGIVARAQTGANVAVVINEESATSKQIGEYYVEKRGIPESNVIRLRMPPEEGISRAAYAALIERPIALALTERGLQDRVLYLVLTKGVPLRILGTSERHAQEVVPRGTSVVAPSAPSPASAMPQFARSDARTAICSIVVASKSPSLTAKIAAIAAPSST